MCIRNETTQEKKRGDYGGLWERAINMQTEAAVVKARKCKRRGEGLEHAHVIGLRAVSSEQGVPA